MLLSIPVLVFALFLGVKAWLRLKSAFGSPFPDDYPTEDRHF